MPITYILTLVRTNQSSYLVIILLSLLLIGVSFAAPKSPTNVLADGRLFGPNECVAAKPEWIFCSGFEEGNKDIWDDYDGNPDTTNQLISSPGPFNLQNNNVMRLMAPSSGRGGADLIKILPDSYDRLYMRWYIKWEQGYDFTVMNHVGGGMHAGERNLLGRSNYRPDGTDMFSSLLEVNRDTQVFNAYTYYRGMYMDCTNPNGQCWGDLLPCTLDEGQTYCTKNEHRNQFPLETVQSEKWYCVEMMIDAGNSTLSSSNANGQLNLWVNGEQIGPWDKMWFRTTPDLKINTVWLSVFFHGEHPSVGIQYDNLVVSKKQIGC